MLQVVAGIIERQGRVLICQRSATQAHPLEWEFPGGKVETGETPEQALARELQEELAVDGVVAQEMVRYPFAYPGKSPIELIFLRVTTFEGEPANLIFADIRWETRGNLPAYAFLAGDRAFLACYVAGRY